MASVFSHAVAALAIGACFYKPGTPKRVWVTGALCSVIPDLDVLGFGFGVRYGDFWGHRGFTHSLLFAALLASAVALLLFRQAVPGFGGMLPVELFFPGDSQPRLARRHDRRRSRRRFLLPLP
jgi:inner membrane protein